MKKFICLLMAMLLIALAACNPQGNPEESVDSHNSQEESVPESQPEEPSYLNVPFEQEGFVLTIHSFEREGNVIRMELTILRNETGDDMNLQAKDRFRLIAADKQITYLSEALDMDGNSLFGSYVETGEPVHMVAVFKMEEDFEPVQFRFVYDLWGFRYFKIDL